MPVRCALGCGRLGEACPCPCNLRKIIKNSQMPISVDKCDVIDETRLIIDSRVHRFPDHIKNPEQFRAWVHIMGRKLETPEDYLQYKHKRVCAIHFTEKDKTRNNRLNALAIPSQHLPDITTQSIATEANIIMNEATLVSKGSFMSSLVVPKVATVEDNTTQSMATEANILMNEATTSYVSTKALSSLVSKGSFISSLVVPEVETIEDKTTELMAKEAKTRINEASTSCAATKPQKSLVSKVASSSVVPEVAVIGETSSVPIKTLVELEHNYCLKPKTIKNFSNTRIPSLELANMKTTVKKVKNLKSEILRLRKRCLSYKTRLENAKKISDSEAFKQITKHMTKPAKLFTLMNFREAKKKPKGKRFSIDEKILSLSIFKKSPKCYSLLAKYFTLPSKKTLKILLSSVELKPGINKIIFEKIQNTVKSMNTEDTLCTLIFDEMSIAPQIHYDRAKDQLKGFTTLGTAKICDHVLVFMVKGLKLNYKQPVAYYFTNSLRKEELKTIIIEVIKNVQATGLRIMGTVCDQSTVNVSAINSLVNDTKANCLRKGTEWRHEHFKINKKTIIPIYDCPHLIKGLRNNLLTKDLIYMDDGKHKKIVKWDYFQMLYAVDVPYGDLRTVQKLTEEHVVPEKIKKMKVKTAAQVFSHSVAIATKNLCDRGDLPQECRDLVPFVLLVDNLFDSLNNNTFHIPNGKIYRAGVKKNSPHHELWQKSIKFLKSVKFIAKKLSNKKIQFIETTVPSITNFIKTIEAVQNIWNILHKKYSFDVLLTRYLNQDPLENFFGNIRSYGGRNVAPNSVNFEGAFKALLLNNYSSHHSIQANCEKDDNDILQDLKFFLSEKPIPKDAHPEAELILNEEVMKSFDDTGDEDKGQRNYVCGWVVTKCLKNLCKKCKLCRKELVDCDDNSAPNALIRAKEYNKKKKWLCYPTKSTATVFHNIQKITCAFLKNDVPKYGLKRKIKIICDLLIKNYNFTCRKHNLKEYFLNVSINVLICSWCRSINRILLGKINYNGQDSIKSAAQDYYIKHKKYKQK